MGIGLLGGFKPSDGWAQDAASVGFEYIAPVALGAISPETPQGQVSLVTVDVKGGFPFKLTKSGTYLIPGVSFRGAVPVVGNGARDVVDSFYELGPQLTFIQPLAERWTLISQLGVSLATNFVDVDADHVRLAGAVLAQYRVSDNLRLGAGVVGNYVFGDFMMLPGLQVRWRATESLRLYLFFPSQLRIGWRVLEAVDIGVRARVVGNQYMIRDQRFPEIERLIYTVVDAAAFVDVRLFRGTWLSFWGGHSLFRNFSVRTVEDREIGEDRFANAPVFGVSIALRPD